MLDPTISRRPWSDADDAALAAAVARHGAGRWMTISKDVPHRTDAQCRRRWCQKNPTWEPERPARRWAADEEASLRRLVGELGRDAWETIAERLGTGRSASACEQKWQSLMNGTDLTPAPAPDAPAPAPIDALLRDVAEEDELAAAPVAATALAAVQRAEVLSRRLEAQTREVEVALAGGGPADDGD